MDWERILETLGLNSPQWRWRIRRWQARWEAFAGRAAVRREQVAYRNRMCHACGALVDGRDRVCPRCGQDAGSHTTAVMRRVFGLVLPKWAPATALILFANVAHLAAVLAVFGWRQLLQPDTEALLAMGACSPDLVLGGEPWRLLTYAFLHIGIIHFAFNMLALSQVGPMLEEEIGWARFTALYALSAVAGAWAEMAARGMQPLVLGGASGSLFGLIGFGIAYGHFYGGPAGRAQRDFNLRWAAYGMVFGFVMGAANWAHLGGCLAGAVLGFLVERERRARARWNAVWTVVAALCAAAMLVSLALMALQVGRGL